MDDPAGPEDPHAVTLTDLHTLQVREDVAEEAYRHATARLQDVLDTRKSYESKAIGLLNVYVTLALATFGVSGWLLAADVPPMPWPPFVAAGLVLMVGVLCAGASLFDAPYGTLGSDPGFWLRKGTIDGVDGIRGRTIAYVVWHMSQRIETSFKANDRKKLWLRLALSAGAAAPAALAITLLICVLVA